MPDFPLPAGSCRYIMYRISDIIRYNVRANAWNITECIYICTPISQKLLVNNASQLSAQISRP